MAALAPDPSKLPARTTKLFGYPGPSTEPDAVRLWLDLDLSSYVDVPEKSILFSKTLPEDFGTVLWVAAGAELKYSSLTSHCVQAEFLSGALTTAHLRSAAVPTPGPPGAHPYALLRSM